MKKAPFVEPHLDQPGAAFRDFILSAFVAGGVILIFSFSILNLYDATQVFYGATFSVVNLLFYSLVAGMIFVKKNVAWVVPIIVLKYALLIVAIYLVWAHCDALLVAAGMLAELILTAFVWLIFKRVILQRTKNGPL